MLNSTAQESKLSAQKWWLHIQSQRFELEKGKMYLVGRLPDSGQASANIAVAGESLDAKHSLIEVSNDVLQILDLCSQSGTFVNDERLEPMKNKSLSVEASLRFGEVTAQLRIEETEMCRDSSGFLEEQNKLDDTSLNKSTSPDNFLVPAAPGRKSLLGDTSARLFDDESFNIPETQHVRHHTSTSDAEESRENSLLGKSDADEDESFIPETQQLDPQAVADVAHASPDNLTEDANIPKSFDMFRICTQDFNENLFGDDVDDDAFTSLVIPKIQHNPVVLQNVLLAGPVTVNNKTASDVSKQQDVSADVEMATLNWSAQTENLDGTAENAQCAERDDVCTPDLFDLPQLAQANAQLTTTEIAKEISPSIKATAEVNSSINRDKTSINFEVDDKEECPDVMELMATQVFVPIPKKEQPQEKPLSEELSPSGKENQLPENMETAMEPTQVFFKTKGSESNKNLNNHIECIETLNKPDAVDPQTISPYPPTQIFAVTDDTNSTEQTPTLKKKLNSSKREANEPEKSVSNQSETKEHRAQRADGSELQRKKTEKIHTFKTPRRENCAKNMKASSDISSVADPEDLQLCTPKWIQDNFDELAQEQKTVATKHVLFGSDSEDEVDHIDKIIKKKVSNDFGKLLSKVKDDATPSSTTKRESNKPVELNIEPTTAKVVTKLNTKMKENNKNEKCMEDKREPKVRLKRTEVTTCTKENKKARTSSSSTSIKEDDVPGRRMTRLRSQASSSSAAGIKNKEVKDTSNEAVKKPRLTRSHSKTDSNDSKSEDIKNKRSKTRNNSPKHFKEKETSGNTVSRKSSTSTKSQVAANKSNESIKTVSQESTSPSKSASRKHKEVASRDEPPKRLRSLGSLVKQEPVTPTRRKIQVATTMVDPTLFQSLLENAQGNWCIANDPSEADVLIMDTGIRTLKFLIAMAKGIPIFSSKWLESFNATKTIPKGMAHFEDPGFERRHKFSLLKSMDLARRQKLFEGYEFLTTSGIMPQPSDMKAVIKCAGGIIHDQVPSPKENQKVFLVSTPNDKKHWHKYRRSNNNIQITSTEGVMAAVMRQQIKPLEMHRLS